MGLVGVAFHQLLQAEALRLTSAVNTGWLIGLIPVWSALLAAALGKERFGAGKVLGLAVGFGGALPVLAASPAAAAPAASLAVAASSAAAAFLATAS